MHTNPDPTLGYTIIHTKVQVNFLWSSWSPFQHITWFRLGFVAPYRCPIGPINASLGSLRS